MKETRSPVIVDVLFGLEWFLLVAAAIIPFLYLGMDDPLSLCLKILLCSVAYVLNALAVRVQKFVALRFIVPVLALAGCVLLGEGLAERLILGAVGVMAAICGSYIFFVLRKGSQSYSGMLFFTVILVVLAYVSVKLEMPQEDSRAASTWVACLSAVYLPLCLSSVMLNRLQDSLTIFGGRSEQPVSHVKKRVLKVIAAVALAVLLAMLTIPGNGGVSYLGSLVVVLMYLFVGLLSKLFSVCAPIMPEEQEEEIQQQISGMPPMEENIGGRYLIFAVFMLIVVIAAIYLLVWLVRLVRQAVLGMLKKEKTVRNSFAGKFDTVEKIEVSAKKDAEKRSASGNAAKVRRIYKKRITAILGKENILRGSLTPAEIVRLCRKKGQDVSALTDLYCKARYTRSCTDEDVKAAKQL